MRRIVGLVLAGLGTCLIVFAVLMPTYVSSRVLKFPLNQFATATLVDSNASYFSPTKLSELSPVTMEATYTLKGNKDAGSSSTAVWNQFVYVYDQTNHQPFQTMTRTMAFDRRNAQLVSCCGANVNGDSSVQQRGIVGYVFPIGTKQQTYQVFDANLLKPVPFTYQGTDTVNGIKAYRFLENVPPTQNGSRTVPGSLVGQSQSSVTLPQFYQAKVTYWIDPDTGALLKATQDEKVFLGNSSGAQALLLFNGNLVMTPASVRGLVAIDNDQRSKKNAVETILPLVTGIAGAVLLVVGILLARRPREDVEAPLSPPSPAPSAATETAAPETTAPETTAAETTAPAEAAAPEAAERPPLVPGLEDKPHDATAESPQAATPEAKAADAAPEVGAREAGAPGAPAAEAAAPAEAPTTEMPAASEAAAAEAPAAEARAAETPAPEARAADTPAAEARAADTPAAEAPAGETSAADAAAETPAAETPASDAKATAEAPQADTPTDAPSAAQTAETPTAQTAETPAAQTSETLAAPTAPQPTATATQPTAPRNGTRRGARHRR